MTAPTSDKGALPTVVMYFGEEDFLVEDAARTLFDRIAAYDSTGMNADILDGDQTSLDAIISVARSYPMMSDHRVVWVRRFDHLSLRKDRKGRDPLTTYLNNPAQHTTLIITGAFEAAHGVAAMQRRNATSAQKKIAAMRFPLNALLQHAAWTEFPRLRENQVGSWLSKYGNTNGFSITDEAVELLCARIGTGIRELLLEIEKIRAYIPDGTPITEQAVRDVVGSEQQATILDLQKAIAKRNTAMAQRIVHNMLSTSRQEMLIVNALARFFTACFMLVELRGTADPSTIAQRIGVPPFALNDYMDAVQAYGANGVERAIIALAEADSQLKSTGGDSLSILQSMIASVAQPAK